MKSSGPKIDPCGTPHVIFSNPVFPLLSLISNLMYYFRPVRQLSNQDKFFPFIP